MPGKRINPRLMKRHRAYSMEEVAIILAHFWKRDKRQRSVPVRQGTFIVSNVVSRCRLLWAWWNLRREMPFRAICVPFAHHAEIYVSEMRLEAEVL
jgi:hypothetical protein